MYAYVFTHIGVYMYICTYVCTYSYVDSHTLFGLRQHLTEPVDPPPFLRAGAPKAPKDTLLGS